MNIFKKKGTNIGGIVNPIKEDAFLDTGETKYVNTQEYKDYTQTSGRGETAFPFQSDYNRSRALNQSNWEQFGHATGRLLPNTVLEIVNQTASILDVEDYFNADNEVGNWLSTWATEAKAAVDESMPIYQENPGEALQVGDFAWWMENGTNLVQSASAFAALGYATGGASLAGLTKGAKAQVLLQCVGLWFTKSGFGCSWKAVQVKVEQNQSFDEYCRCSFVLIALSCKEHIPSFLLYLHLHLEIHQ